MWAIRLLHELPYYENSCFLTLTYDDENLPPNGSLDKRHTQLFFKSLRNKTSAKFKYFCCGEYGSETVRPHYHIILFGLGRTKKDKDLYYDCWRKCSYHGIHCGSVTAKSCRYVSDYITSKITGSSGRIIYKQAGIIPPFLTCSQGIGLKWAKTNEQYLKQQKIINLGNGTKVPLPRYYRKKLEIPLDDEVLGSMTFLPYKERYQREKNLINKIKTSRNRDISK